MTEAPAINSPLQQDQQSLLVFRVADSYCCILAASVASIIEPPAITKLPLSPHSLAGIIDFNNIATPVHCLRTYFDTPVNADNNNGVIIIVNTGTSLTGFWVDEALDIIDASSSDFHERDPILPDSIVTHIVTQNEQLLLYIDCRILDRAFNGLELNNRNQEYPVNSNQDNSIDTNPEPVKQQEQRETTVCPGTNNIDVEPDARGINNKISSEHPDTVICTNQSAVPVAGESIYDEKANANVSGDALKAATETSPGDSNGQPAENRYEFYKGDFSKAESKEAMQDTTGQHQSFTLLPPTLPTLWTNNIPASCTNTESGSRPAQQEMTPASQQPSPNIIKRLSFRWIATLLLLLTLLPVLVWRSLSDNAVTTPQVTSTVSTNNQTAQQKHVNDDVAASKMGLTANGQEIATADTDSHKDSTNVTNPPAKPAKKPGRNQVILGLKTQTYSITVERPSANVGGERKAEPVEYHGEEPTATTNTNQQQQLSDAGTDTGRLSFIEEQPSRSLDHSTLNGNTDDWNMAQYEEFIYIVVKGDTLWDIAAKYLGDPFQYKRLSELSYVRDPDWIYPGDIVRIRKVIRPQIPVK